MSFQDIKKFSSTQINKLLKAAGINPSRYFLRNVKLVCDELDGYQGPIKYRDLRRFILTRDENDINRIQPGLYKDRVNENREHVQNLMNIQANHTEPNENREHVQNLMNMRLPPTRTKKSHQERTEPYAEAIRQLVAARKVIRSKQKHGKKFAFDFTVMDDANRNYFNNHVGAVLIEFIKSINFTQQWICTYEFETYSKNKPLNTTNIGSLLHQLKSNGFISDVEASEAGVDETNYDYILYGLENLTKLIFEDVSLNDNKKPELQQKILEAEANDENLQYLIRTNAPQSMIDNRRKEIQAQIPKPKKRKYKTRDGQFWKYICDIPINLERFQIFNTINKRTADMMTSDNCLVYACIQAGVSSDIIDRMRDIIRTRAFPQHRLQKLADETGIKFNVRIAYLNSDEKIATKNKYETYAPTTEPVTTINLVLIDGHYCLDEDVPVSPFFIKHYDDIIKKLPSKEISYLQKINRFQEGKYKIKSDIKTNIVKIFLTLFETNHFIPITYGDINVYSTSLYKEKLQDFTTLDYNKKFCVRKKFYDPKREEQKLKYDYVLYADFECSTDGIHKAFNICFESADGKVQDSFWGNNCAKMFLDVVPNNSLVYYHNLSYDINFVINELTGFVGTPIIKGSRTMMIRGIYKGKNICFKDSYAIISKPLKMFPSMFKLKTGPKEVFPYTYYSSVLLQNNNRIGCISEAAQHVSDKKTFINNIKNIKGCKLGKDSFDLEKYSTYYCSQDVRILREGFERFRSDLLAEFKLDAYDFVSICSIANKYFENEVYFKNQNLYDLAGKPREFISRCVQGGRCMLADNQKQKIENEFKVVDFDAVSLYPSAYARLYTVEGVPKVIPDEWLDTEFLLQHLMDDDQTVPTKEKFMSSFFIEIQITSIGHERHMPLIVVDHEQNPELADVERSSNTCCLMYVDHITFQDLIRFQKIEAKIIRGYYYDGNRDTKIQNTVQNLFNLRLRYKKEDNPLQEVIKLILNSIYGRTILRPIEDKMVFIQNNKKLDFIRKNYNSIIDIEDVHGSEFCIFKCVKPIVRHYNFCPLGVNILSMSKRIMNEVFTLAEDFRIKIFYQDTDSGHYFKKDLPVLAKLFKARYGRELIGKNLGQFHSDFAEIDAGHESYASTSIFCGKKTYIDMLTNDLGHVGFHVRMKGVKQDVIAITANEMFPNTVQCAYNENTGIFEPIGEYSCNSKFSLLELYKHLYDGNAVTFDLCKGRNPCFDRKNNFTVETKSSFKRELVF